MSEEDQMMRAIAMSLGQEVSMEQRSDSPEVCLFKLRWLETCFQNEIIFFCVLTHLCMTNCFLNDIGGSTST